MSAPALDRDDVLAELRDRVPAVLAHFGVKGRRSGKEYRTRTCPVCGDRARPDTVSINLGTGQWRDHAHGCSGDVLSLVAGLAGLDVRTQFRLVLGVAADIAGFSPMIESASERAHRRGNAARLTAERDAEQRIEEQRRRLHAIAMASMKWDRLATESNAGEQYLRARGVSEILASGLVRFSHEGDIALALLAAEGEIVNVARRRLHGAPKVVGLPHCATLGTFGNSIADIEHGRPVILVEGVFDAITSRLAWPDAVVLGCHGASNAPKIAASAVRRIRLAKTSLALVPHNDDAGMRAMTAAGRIAQQSGLRLGRDLNVIDCGAKDLNDAWLAGWRPR